MSTGRSVTQKVGDWNIAYGAIREELTPPALRKILAEMEQVEGVQQFRSYVDLARTVMANDRAAGTIAALITQTGIKPVSVDYGDDE
jgi:hypothetical protein